MQEATLNPQRSECLEAAKTALVPPKEVVGDKRRENAKSQVRDCVMISRKACFSQFVGRRKYWIRMYRQAREQT